MRRLCYAVASSLDGFIAGPHGEYDWIVRDPSIDFAAKFAQYDTLLMGRGTYEIAKAQRNSPLSRGQKWIVVSRTLKPAEHPDITILSSGVAVAVDALKAQPGKDIWLFGGGVLFRNLLDTGLVDSVELAVSPVLLAAASGCCQRAGAGHYASPIARPCRRVGS